MIKNQEINLTGNWNSSFIENDKIFNESLRIKQDGNKLVADIILEYDEKEYAYNFEGTITNNIINGTYQDNELLESGAISLKIVNDHLLFGVTTFIMNDRSLDIVQTPYILFRNANEAMGTFGLCHGCIGKKNNCCCSDYVDVPVVLPFEIEQIEKMTGLDRDIFAQAIDFKEKYQDETLKTIYCMKRNPNNEGCYFYQDNKCQIYNKRPIDCRMFPYDVKLEEDGKYYLIHYIIDECFTNAEDPDNILAISYNTRLYLRLMRPYIREATNNALIERLSKKAQYKVIKEIDDLF